MSKKQISGKGLSRREILKYGLYGGVAAGLSSGLWVSCRRQRRGTRPNIILICVDTLRPDHLGCYGYERQTSVNVDKFTAESVLFENCFSHAPSTSQSCASFLSGFLPHETKVLSNTTPVPLKVPMAAKILKKAGYKTYGVVSNYVLRRKHGFYRGFDVYNDQMDDRELVRKSRPERIAENTTTCAIEMLKQHKEGSLFMWIHYQDPHGPYTPKEPYDSLFLNYDVKPFHLKFNDSISGKDGIPSYQRLGDHTDYHYYVAQYDGEIRYFDEHFGRLVRAMKELDLYDDSMIILTADHGEALGEYNYFFVHGQDLNNCLIHVPLIVKYRGIAPARREDFVQHIDIVPTILKAIGIKAGVPYRGRDLLIRHPKPAVICSELLLDSTSVIVDGLKLTMYGKHFWLFEINSDPYEEHDLVDNAAYRERLLDLSSHLMRFRREDFLRVGDVGEKPQLTDEERAKLRSLGYVE